MSFFIRRYEELGEWVESDFQIKKSLCVNSLKISDERLLKRLRVKTKKIPFLEHGYYYESKYSLGSTPEYLFGYYYLQEAASQVPALILRPKANETVLDMAAAPGGKTIQMAQLMQDRGSIYALDNNMKRLESLRNNLERIGVKSVATFRKDARYASDFEVQFDKVLLDAPCSGNFTDDPEWLEKRTIQDIEDRSKLQKELLKSAYKVLKKGGVLVYSTCTLEPEENEMNVDWFIKEYPDMKLQDIDLEIGDSGIVNPFGKELDKSIEKCKRFWPHKTGTQGFFVAKLKKENNK